MDRRDLLALTGAALLCGSAGAAAQPAVMPGVNAANVIRIYATPDGASHVEILTISSEAKPIPVTRMTASAYAGSGVTAPDWHTAPRKQFAINMSGALEVELSDGTRQRIGSDLVYLEDLTGKGHVTRALGPVTNVFIHVPEDFDVVAWAAGD
jgi:hypothetical protein